MALEDFANSVSEFWENLKAGYQDFIANLAARGVPAPHILVPVIVLIAIIAAGVLLAPALAPRLVKVTYTVKDQTTLAAIDGASVTLFDDSANKTFDRMLTDSSGQAIFANVPEGMAQRVEVSASNYQTSVVKLGAGTLQKQILLQSSVAALKKVVVNVKDDQGKPLPNALVELSSELGTNTGVSGADGNAEISTAEIPLVATIRVSSAGFASEEQSKLGADLTAGPVTIQLKAKSTGADPTLADKGTLSVIVTDLNTGDPVRAQVSLLADGSLAEVSSTYSGASDGVAAFNNIAFGTKVIVSAKDPEGKYADYSSSVAFEFTKDTTSTRALLRTRTSTGSAESVVTLKDKDGAAIPDGTVNVFDRSSGKLLIGDLRTDSSGNARFNIARGLPLYITAQKIAASREEKTFLPGFLFALAGDSRTLTLQEAVEGNTALVKVQVTGDDGLPVPTATVALYARGGTFDGFYLSGTTSSADGVALIPLPTTLSGQAYKVFAKATRGEDTGQSDVLEVSLAMPPLDVLVRPPQVVFSVKTIDFISKSPVPAQVAAFAGNALLGTCSTASAPSCKLNVTAGVPFIIVANAPGFLTYTSAQETLAATDKKEFKAQLFSVSAATATSITFLGLFNDKGAVREVANNERYKARFLVTVPSADASGVYVRVGSAANVADDVAGISDFDRAVTPSVYTSLSYTPEQGCAADVPKGELAGRVKAVEFQFPKGTTGTREVSLVIETSKNITAGSTLDIAYRSYALKQTAPSLFPADVATLDKLVSKLAAGQRLTAQDFCTAPVKIEKVQVTRIPLQCDEASGICARVFFQDPITNKLFIDAPSVPLGQNLNAFVEVLSEKSNVDTFKLQTAHFQLLRTTPTSASLQGPQPAGPPALVIPIAATVGKKVGVQMQLRATKASSAAPLTFTFEPAAGESFVVSKTASVTGTNTFNVDVAPSNVYAAEGKRNVNFLVRDRLGKIVTDATIELYDCDNAPLDGQVVTVTGDGSRGKGENGRYIAQIIPVAIGEIGVRVSGEGFRSFDECLIPIKARSFIEVTPESMKFEGDSSTLKEAQTITVSNLIGTEARVSANVRCLNPGTVGGAPVGNSIRIFPLSCKLKSNSDCKFNVQTKQNVTANTLCIVTFQARAGQFARDEAEVAVQNDVSCPSCPTYLEGLPRGVASLPSRIQLFLNPYNPIAQQVYFVNLGGTPRCEIEGLQPLGGYGAGAAGYYPPWAIGFGAQAQFSVSPFAGAQLGYGQLGGLPASCGPPYICSATGRNSCPVCANPALYGSQPLPMGCTLTELCSSPTKCSQLCGGASSLYNNNYNPNIGYAYGYPLQSPYGGASQYNGYAHFMEPGSFGYSPGWFGQDSAVTIDECSATAIAVSTNFVGLPPVSMAGRIRITLPDGAQQRIPFSVIVPPAIPPGIQQPQNDAEWLKTIKESVTIEVPFELEGTYQIAAGDTDIRPLCTLKDLSSTTDNKEGDRVRLEACSEAGVKISYDFKSLEGKNFDQIRSEIEKKKVTVSIRGPRAEITKDVRVNFKFPFKTPTMQVFVEYFSGQTYKDPLIGPDGLVTGLGRPVEIGNGSTELALGWVFPEGDDPDRRYVDIVKGLNQFSNETFYNTDAHSDARKALQSQSEAVHQPIIPLGLGFTRTDVNDPKTTVCKATSPCRFWVRMHAFRKDSGAEIPGLPFQRVEIIEVGSDTKSKSNKKYLIVG